jgi:hypothetical protein
VDDDEILLLEGPAHVGRADERDRKAVVVK